MALCRGDSGIGSTTVGEFLLRRLKEAGVDHIFGVPGDFVLGFFNNIISSNMEYIGCCNELNAAYSADGYARMKGIGCICTTYCVGELSAINGVAGSWAESVPVVKITGCPASQHFRRKTLLHHSLGDYTIPMQMYEKITVASTMLNDPRSAPFEIDRVLSACLQHRKPVYIGVCSDIVYSTCNVPFEPLTKAIEEVSDEMALEEALLETITKLQAARKPLLIPGVEIKRRGLKTDFETLLNKSGLPYATMMLGKAVLDEDHPQFIGLYSGDRSRDYVRTRVENSDCLIIFGEKLTDFNTGGFSAILDDRCTIYAEVNCVKISHHVYHNVFLHDYMRGLSKMIIKRSADTLDIQPAHQHCAHAPISPVELDHSKDLTMNKMFDMMSHYIPQGAIVFAETGASLFSAAEVLMPRGTEFIGQTFYGSIGYTVGGCLGACIAAPDRKVILFVGDGSFQVCCQELSTMIRNRCQPVIFLLNNDGYTIERVIYDNVYNDLQMWKYAELPAVFGGGTSKKCKTEGELEEALEISKSVNDLCFFEVILDKMDCNDSLRKAGETMAKTNRLDRGGSCDQMK